MTAAAFATTARLENFFRSWHCSALQGFGDETVDRSGNTLQRVLGLVKSLDASMIIAARPEFLKALNFSFIQLLSSAVELLQLIAQSHHLPIQANGLFISQESFRLITCGADLRVCSDG
jgi:hypothetical protein